MNFKIWLENNNAETQELKDILIKFAKEKKMPMPTTYLDSGSDAIIFNTTDDNTIARITKNENENFCEKVISSPEVQKTGAVVKVFSHSDYDNHLITYKEKVNIYWENFLLKKNPNNYNEILSNLLNLVFDFYDHDKLNMSKKIKNLTKYNETKKIAILLAKMPFLAKDLHEGNMGINKDGNIVIIDC